MGGGKVGIVDIAGIAGLRGRGGIVGDEDDCAKCKVELRLPEADDGCNSDACSVNVHARRNHMNHHKRGIREAI